MPRKPANKAPVLERIEADLDFEVAEVVSLRCTNYTQVYEDMAKGVLPYKQRGRKRVVTGHALRAYEPGKAA